MLGCTRTYYQMGGYRMYRSDEVIGPEEVSDDM